MRPGRKGGRDPDGRPSGAKDDPRFWSGALLPGALRGDPAALDVALGEVRPLVVRAVARRLGGSRAAWALDTAEDIAQIALARVAVHVAECRATTPKQFAAWALAVAARAVADAIRYRANEGAARFDTLDEHAVRGAAVPDALVAPDAPGDVPTHDALSPAVRVALRVAADQYGRLDAVAADLLWRRGVLDEGWRAIARDLGVTPAAAKRRYQRAQAAMREAVLREVGALPDDALPAHERERAVALVRGWAA